MPSPLITTTIQAAILSAISNILAQLMTAYQQQQLSRTIQSTSSSPLKHLSLTPILHFILFTILSCPPNFLWQKYLERRFPGQQESSTTAAGGVKKEEKPSSQARQNKSQKSQLSVRNTLIKLLLDQTVAASVNTTVFIAVMAGLRGASAAEIADAVRKGFWPVTKAGWKLWPVVSLVNFTFVPVERRVIVGSLVGVAWGVYLSLVAGR